jgi:predicted TIM-barrel fold metal-dependent hydrolase
MTSILATYPKVAKANHPAADFPIQMDMQAFFSRQVFNHFIWGGVLERHPRLNLVLTEMGSGWVIGTLAEMEHRYKNSFLRRDIREALPHNPQEYFDRQVMLGSSIFSRAEIAARHEIGLNKMMIGMDFPHHEGTVDLGTLEYLRQTFGVLEVPVAEAQQLLADNAVAFFGLDASMLRNIANQVGPDQKDVLGPPEMAEVVRGDVHKPLSFLTG